MTVQRWVLMRFRGKYHRVRNESSYYVHTRCGLYLRKPIILDDVRGGTAAPSTRRNECGSCRRFV